MTETPQTTTSNTLSGTTSGGQVTFTTPQYTTTTSAPNTTQVTAPAESKPDFPPNTPVADMDPAEQAAYWRDKAQKHEKAWRGKVGSDLTPEQYAAERAELEQLRDSTRNDSEKAIEQAKKDGRAEASAEFAPKLVSAAFGAALAGMQPEDRAELMDTINPAAFLSPNGDLDADKVSNWIAKYGPQSDKGVGDHVADHGGGRRSTTRLSPRDAGLAEAQRRFPNKATA